ncbi:MAG: fused MFS/spermidine synthase [Planctomycetes bacterium]|nr:fused MFS/spermidine synthase [Planctomycetota bacterium]
MRRSDLVFFLSGAAALVEETVWARWLARIVGSDAAGAALVVSIFLLGLGLGAVLFARAAERVHAPRRAYALLELSIGAWAAATPFMLSNAPPLETFAARAAFALLVLLPPALGFGASVPLMARLAVRSRAEATSETSAFYGANTLGAAAGALAAPFLLLPAFGLPGALWAAAGLEFLAAGLALWLLAEPPPAAGERAPALAPPSGRFHPLLVAALLLGFASLALEIALLRLLVTVTGASVYAFGIVLAVFLFGIGLGARQLAARRTRSGLPESALPERAERARGALFLAALAAPLLVACGLLALRLQLGEADLFAGLANRGVQGGSILRAWLAHALFAGLALLPPAIAFGVALPAAAGAIAADRPDAERERWIARTYSWNTAGALAGSLGAAFVLIPACGPRGAVVAALAAPFVAAWIVAPARRGLLALAIVGTLAVANASVLPAGEREAPRPRLLAHDAHTTASVHEATSSRGEPVLALRVNGKAEASTAPVDRRLQYLLGHVPGLLHGEVRRALVIGLGTGMTAGSLLDLPQLEALEIAEISPAVARAAREFGAWNGRVLDDARTRLVIADGRQWLALAREPYDLVTSDPVHPWTRGSSDLYTLEHFRTMRARLAPGGVASQWLPLYELSTEDVRTVAATWAAAFERVSAWVTAYDLVLVGAAAELPGEASLLERALPPRVREHLAPLGIRSGRELAALQVASDARLRAFAAGTRPMRDDRPVLEFRAPRAALAGYCVDVLRWAAEPAGVEELAPVLHPLARAHRAALLGFLDDLPDGFLRAADALGERLEDLSDAR